jgi:hypothetical protein
MNHDEAEGAARASALCALLHRACDLVEDAAELDTTTREELEQFILLALVAGMRWRAEAMRAETGSGRTC